MVTVTNINVSQKYSSQFLAIDFEINNTTEDLSNYQFDILRSDATNGDFITIGTNIKEYSFKDYSVNLLNPVIEYYYKIRVIDKLNNEVYESDISKIKFKSQDNYVVYFNYLNTMYLESVIADDKLKLLKKKRFGEYCECYDDVREKSRKPNCTSCYGTKFKGGYFEPIDISANFLNSATLTEEFDMKGISQAESPTQFWTTSYPQITQGDIIVLPDNSRHKVISWNSSDKNGVSIRQMITIQRIPPSDVVYKYPIEED